MLTSSVLLVYHVNKQAKKGSKGNISSKSDANLNVISIFFLHSRTTKAKPYRERCRSWIFFFSGKIDIAFESHYEVYAEHWHSHAFSTLFSATTNFIFLLSRMICLGFLWCAWCHNKSRLHSIRHPLVIYLPLFFLLAPLKKWNIYKFRD